MELSVPGDKSISQRGLILAALAKGRSRLQGTLTSADPRSTAHVLRDLGTAIPDLREGELVIQGRGLRGLAAASAPLDCGNSGTCARMMLGVLAGQPGEATLTGDASLRGRPMARVADPLRSMGAAITAVSAPGRLPLRVQGRTLQNLDFVSPVASAQVKSSLLLAGLTGGASVTVTEPVRSRDHTERMLQTAGVQVTGMAQGTGWRVVLGAPPDRIDPLDLHVPGDFSSAAFFLVLSLLGVGGAEVLIRKVGLNPTRTGLLPVLARMGADVSVEELDPSGESEPMGHVAGRPSFLRGIEVGGDEVPGLIDEIPILAVAAARAAGVTRITGAEELRVKESDRIAVLVNNLRAVGVKAEELVDGMEIEGTDAPLQGRVSAHEDHRIAMAFGVLGALPGNRIEVDHPEVANVSFPGFWSQLDRSVARRGAGTDSASSASSPSSAEPTPRRPPVVTIDGPAGSGKSSTAREVARRLSFRHLDSGALYRAITFALLKGGVPDDQWAALQAGDLDEYPIEMHPTPEGFDLTLDGRVLGPELRTPLVTGHVSNAAGQPAVRAWLLERQREAGHLGGLVADGRDMGSVVFPNAEVKVFLDADLNERARRRLLQDTGTEPDADAVLGEARRIEARDRADSERQTSPLRIPEGATRLDTTELTMDEQVERVVKLVQSV